MKNLIEKFVQYLIHSFHTGIIILVLTTLSGAKEEHFEKTDIFSGVIQGNIENFESLLDDKSTSGSRNDDIIPLLQFSYALGSFNDYGVSIPLASLELCLPDLKGISAFFQSISFTMPLLDNYISDYYQEKKIEKHFSYPNTQGSGNQFLELSTALRLGKMIAAGAAWWFDSSCWQYVNIGASLAFLLYEYNHPHQEKKG